MFDEFQNVPKRSTLSRRHDSAAPQHGPNFSSDSKEFKDDGRMLPPLEGPSISQGKGIVMSTVNKEKNVASQDATIYRKDPSSNIFEGTVISIIGNKLVMTNKEGNECSHTLAKDAKLTCDGTVCKMEDLKAGSKIRVTTKKGNRNVATGIECLDKNAEFGQCCG